MGTWNPGLGLGAQTRRLGSVVGAGCSVVCAGARRVQSLGCDVGVARAVSSAGGVCVVPRAEGLWCTTETSGCIVGFRVQSQRTGLRVWGLNVLCWICFKIGVCGLRFWCQCRVQLLGDLVLSGFKEITRQMR